MLSPRRYLLLGRVERRTVALTFQCILGVAQMKYNAHVDELAASQSARDMSMDMERQRRWKPLVILINREVEFRLLSRTRSFLREQAVLAIPSHTARKLSTAWSKCFSEQDLSCAAVKGILE